MAIAKKGSRIITVDGVRYRWRVSPDSGFDVVVVEHAENPGQRINGYCHPYYWAARDSSDGSTAGARIAIRAITPQSIARLIRYAIKGGWHAESKNGKEFRIQPADDILWPEADIVD